MLGTLDFTGSLRTGLPCSLLLRRFVFRKAEASAKQVTGDEPQGTMGRVQAAVVSFPPSFARTFSSKERRLGTRQAPLYFFLEHSLAMPLKLFPINPQLSPQGAYLFEACLMGWGEGGLFDLAKMMVSVLYQTTIMPSRKALNWTWSWRSKSWRSKTRCEPPGYDQHWLTIPDQYTLTVTVTIILTQSIVY